MLCLALLVSFFTGFTTSVYAQEPADHFAVYIKYPGSPTPVLVHNYTIDEFNALQDPDIHYYKGIDSFPTEVHGKGRGVLLSALINDCQQYNSDLSFGPGASLAIYATDTEPNPYCTLTYEYLLGEQRYYYPNYDYQALPNPDLSGAVAVEPMFANISYQKRDFTREQLDAVPMDNSTRYRFYFGQTESGAKSGAVTVMKWVKWVDRVDFNLPTEAPPAPWAGYLVPQDSTGNYGEDTPVELWVTYNDTGLTYGAIAYQADLHFEPGCVNITSANFSTSPFGSHMFTPYTPGVVRILEDNYTSMTPIPSGTYKMATLTLHGESPENCTSDLWFDNNTVSDTDGEPIENSYTNGTFTCAVSLQIFDTNAPDNPYPSISGTHNGTITPNKNISVNYLYTYPCIGTGGHTEFAKIWNETEGVCAIANWSGYLDDYHTISFNRTLPLQEGVVYNYTIRTGSYPQIMHKQIANVTGGTITCDEFNDANGRVYYDWIPAIKLD
jgi:hypothetical protein